MLGFYAVRKLIDATKVDGRIARQTAKVTTYPSTGKRVVRTNWMHYWELYDLESPTSAKLPLILLCHQFVHSYVFSCEFSERKEFESVCVSSDRERNRLLYSVSVPEVIRLFEAVGNSYPNDIRMRFNVKKGDYDVVSRTSKVAHLSHD